MAVGDFDNAPSIRRAIDGVSAIFLNMSPSANDPEAETRQANNIITVATQERSSVQTIVIQQDDPDRTAQHLSGLG